MLIRRRVPKHSATISLQEPLPHGSTHCVVVLQSPFVPAREELVNLDATVVQLVLRVGLVRPALVAHAELQQAGITFSMESLGPWAETQRGKMHDAFNSSNFFILYTLQYGQDPPSGSYHTPIGARRWSAERAGRRPGGDNVATRRTVRIIS